MTFPPTLTLPVLAVSIFGHRTLPDMSETSFTSRAVTAVRGHSYGSRLSKCRRATRNTLPLSSLPRAQQGFNFAALTPAVAPVDREYFYGSLDRKICDQYLELFADFKYVRGFWDGALGPVRVYARRIHGCNSSIRNKQRRH